MHSKRSTQATIKRHTLNVTVQHHLNYETSAEPKPLHVLPKEAVFNTVIKHINDVMGQYVPEGFAKPYSEAVDVWSLEPGAPAGSAVQHKALVESVGVDLWASLSRHLRKPTTDLLHQFFVLLELTLKQ